MEVDGVELKAGELVLVVGQLPPWWRPWKRAKQWRRRKQNGIYKVGPCGT